MGLCKNVPTIHILAVMLGSLEIILFGGVIFGWHSVVYVYKDTDYFSNKCPTYEVSPASHNITWGNRTHPNQVNSSLESHSYFIDAAANVTAALTVQPTDTAFTTLSTYEAGTSNKEGNGRYEELSCDEKIQIQAQTGGGQVCKFQDEQFNLVFSLATGMDGILSLPSGILYDHLGTRVSRIISIISFLGGQICLIFASPESSYLLYPGFVGLVYGGQQIILTNLQLGCLIPSLRSTIMSLYAGSFDASSSVFLLFKAAYEGGVSINTSFTIQATLYFLIVASSTFCLLPKSRIPFITDSGFRLRCWLCHKCCKTNKPGVNENCTSHEWEQDPMGSLVLVERKPNFSNNLGAQTNVIQSPFNSQIESGNGKATSNLSQKDSTEPLEEKVPEKEGMLETKEGEVTTFRQVVFSPLFLTDLLWFSIQRLRSWIFVGMFNPWITRLACGDKALVSHYTSVYASLQFFGILTATLSGRLMDRKIKGAQEKYGDPRHERLHASIAPFVLDSTVSVLLTVCTLIPVLKLQYVTFALHCLHRSFLYGPNSAFVANGFPSQHFGKLFGVTNTASAVFSTLQYPLFLIMQGPLGGDPTAINVFLLVLMIISFIHPLNIWWYLKKKAAKRAAA